MHMPRKKLLKYFHWHPICALTIESAYTAVTYCRSN
jgi:hypothetical protein